MIVRLIDKKGFSKLIQVSDVEKNRNILFLMPYSYTRKIIDWLGDTSPTSVQSRVLEFRDSGRYDYDHNMIFEEF